jgi:hypothetical protein
MIWTQNIKINTRDAFRAAFLLWGFTRDDLLRACRDQRIVHQRWIMFSLLKARGLTTTQIAEEFGLHSSTVVHGLEQHLDQLEPDYIENSDALVELHHGLLIGCDPHPSTSQGCYRDYPDDWYGKQHCPNMGGFSDYDKTTHEFKI